MHSCLLVSGLPRSLPSLPHSPAPPCLPCVEGRQRAAPHSSEFPPTTAALKTLYMDVWGPALVNGTDQERYILLVVGDYTRYTTVFPLRCKADVSGVLIPLIRATRRPLRERFRRDLPVMRLHSDRGSEFSSGLLEEFCRDEGIRQTFTLPASPQQNGIAKHRIGLIMEVARTSMIHAVAPHFLWPFAVRYAAHQLKLWPHVFEPETSPTFRWTGKVGDASVFWVWGALSLVRNAKASKLSSRTLRCIFLGFPTNAPPWLLHPHVSHPVPLAPLFLGHAPLGVSQVDPPPLVEPSEISSDSSGLAEGGDPTADNTTATRRSPRLETAPGFPPQPSSPPPQPAVVDSGSETAGAEPGGAETEGEGFGVAATGGAGSGGAATGGADSGGATSPSGGGAVGDPAGGLGVGQPPQPDLLETLSPEQIRAWIVRRGSPGGGGFGPAGAGAASPIDTAGGAGGAAAAGGTAGAGGTRGAACAGGAGGVEGDGAASAGGAAGAGGAGAASAGGTTGGAAGAGAASAGGAAGAGGPGGTAGGVGAASVASAASAGGAGATTTGGSAGAGGTGGTAGGAGASSAGGVAGAGGTGVAAGAGGAGPAGALCHLLGLPPAPNEFHVAEPETRASVPARVRHVRRPRALAVSGTHDMTLRPSSVPQRVVLPSPPASSLPDVADPQSDLARASSPTVTRFLATVVADSTFSSPGVSALVIEPVDFAAVHRLDYLASLVSNPDPACPPSVGGEVALGCDVLEERQEELECLAAAAPHLATMLLAPGGDPDALDIPTRHSNREEISGEYSSQWQTAMDAEMASWKSTGTYVHDVPPPKANIVSGMWIFRVKGPPGSQPAFKARYVARGFNQREGVDFYKNFSPTPKMTTLRVLLHVPAQRDYELHSLNFSTAFL
ncbi:unnamed protein product [Closterium sp. NIES-54]